MGQKHVIHCTNRVFAHPSHITRGEFMFEFPQTLSGM